MEGLTRGWTGNRRVKNTRRRDNYLYRFTNQSQVINPDQKPPLPIQRRRHPQNALKELVWAWLYDSRQLTVRQKSALRRWCDLSQLNSWLTPG